jgi:hypothetical protein
LKQVLRPLMHDGRPCGVSVVVASNFVARAVGLLGQAALPEGQGLWIAPCASVHTFAMRFAIDVVMLDPTGGIVSLAADLRPWRLGPRGAQGGVAVELASGTIKHLQLLVGDRLTLGDP